MKNRVPHFPATGNHSTHESKESFQELRTLARTKLIRQRTKAEDFLGEYPLSGLAAAVCLGVVLGWFMKRR